MWLSVIVNPWKWGGPGPLGVFAPWEKWSWLYLAENIAFPLRTLSIDADLGRNYYFDNHTKCSVSRILSCLMLILQRMVRYVLNCLSHGKLCLWFVAEERISVKILITEPVNGCLETPGYKCQFFVTVNSDRPVEGFCSCFGQTIWTEQESHVYRIVLFS